MPRQRPLVIWPAGLFFFLKFLSLFNRLVAQVLPNGPQLSDTLWSRTRAECLEVLKTTGDQQLLNSFAHNARLPRSTSHCGVCSQCIDRRFASITAGMEEFDSSERYQTDIFRGRLEGHGLTMAESYLRFAQKVFWMPADELFTEYPQLGDCITQDDPSRG